MSAPWMRWFNTHILDIFPDDIGAFFEPLIRDVATAGGAAITEAVQAAVDEYNADGSIDLGTVFSLAVEAGKKALASQGVVDDVEHIAIGVAAAAVSNLQAKSVGAVLPTATTAAQTVPEVEAAATEGTTT